MSNDFLLRVMQLSAVLFLGLGCVVISALGWGALILLLFPVLAYIFIWAYRQYEKQYEKDIPDLMITDYSLWAYLNGIKPLDNSSRISKK